MSEQTTTMTPTPTRPPLRRTSDRVIAGVAGGVGRWLGIDPTIVRVVLVVLAVFGGSGLILYAAGWLLLPSDDATASPAQDLLDRAGRPGSANRVLLIVLSACVGAFALAWVVGPLAWHGPWRAFGGGSLLLLVAGGLVVWLLVRDSRSGANAAAPVDAPTPAQPEAPDGPLGTALAAAPPAPLVAGFAYGGSGDYPGYSPVPPVPPAPPAPRRPRSYLGLAVLSIAVLVTGCLTALNVLGVTAVPVVVILATGLGILGLGLVTAAFVGRATWLVAIALPVLLVTSLVAVVPANLVDLRDLTVGDMRWVPATAEQAQAAHRLDVGEAVLDLRSLADPATAGPVTARVGVGTLTVVLPDDLAATVDASVGAGSIQVAGHPQVDGTGRTLQTTLPAVGSGPTSSVDLVLEVGLGTVEVTRG